MINQQAIATALGLSTATVSRALRNRGNHDARTRALVLEEAAKLGYRLPKRDAHGETPTRLPTIGVILAAPQARQGELPMVSMRLLQGTSAAARAAGLMLHVEYLTQGDPRTADELLNSHALRPGNIDGVIYIGDVPAVILRELGNRFAGVRIALRDPGITMDGIGQDDVAAVNDLVAHLRSLGHERIGFLGDGTASSFVNARAAAFIQVALQSGQALNSLALVNIGSPALDASSCGAEILAHVERGTRAWICLHDRRAYQLTEFFQQRGMRVPDEVSICGFDALPVPNDLPAMTTIDWPFEAMGSEAVKRLLGRIKATDEPIRQAILPGALIIRASTASRAG